jgi:hypothetical protein
MIFSKMGCQRRAEFSIDPPAPLGRMNRMAFPGYLSSAAMAGLKHTEKDKNSKVAQNDSFFIILSPTVCLADCERIQLEIALFLVRTQQSSGQIGEWLLVRSDCGSFDQQC